MLASLRARAREIKQHLFVLWAAYQDPRTPWYAKLLAICVVAYAFSPIDLIPDFIPVLGLLDDVILVPLGILLVLKLIPEHVVADCRVRAEALRQEERPQNWLAAAVIIVLWLLGAGWLALVAYQWLG